MKKIIVLLITAFIMISMTSSYSPPSNKDMTINLYSSYTPPSNKNLILILDEDLGDSTFCTDCSTYCLYSTDSDTSGSNIVFTGTGEIKINATVKLNYTSLNTKPTTCKLVVYTDQAGKLILEK